MVKLRARGPVPEVEAGVDETLGGSLEGLRIGAVSEMMDGADRDFATLGQVGQPRSTYA
jgi:hypothetical protein